MYVNVLCDTGKGELGNVNSVDYQNSGVVGV